MTNMHVLTKTGVTYRIVGHVAVPVGNNLAGVSYRLAVVRSKLGGTTVLPDGDGTAGTISAAEKTNIVTDGSLYEIVYDLDVTQGGSISGAAILTYMDQDFAARSSEALTFLQGQLVQFGRTR
jgi:hypothetical protein